MNDLSFTPAEEAARRSRRGYDYQDLIAAAFCLEMFSDPRLQKVSCETQDDVVLTWNSLNGNTVHEFVQVKSDRQTQQWSVAQVCEQAKAPFTDNSHQNNKVVYRQDTSIFEKNALRDQGKHISKFRLVTRADVNELRILTKSPDTRSPAEISDLANKLRNKLDGNTTLSIADIEYWVSQTTWDVRGTESAIFAESLRLLALVIEQETQRLLPIVDLEDILQRLVHETRSMAMGKGRNGSDANGITCSELRKWLVSKIHAMPRFPGKAEVNLLLREERHSLARCETLWLALGVSREQAFALAHQPTIGARTEFFSALSPGFYWITARYGAGKTLAVERLFQKQLADYMARRSSHTPIFLRAYGIAGSLQETLISRLRELDRDNESHPLFVIVDAVDEAGVGPAQRLLHEARELSTAWPNSFFIATSPESPLMFDQFRLRLPNLTDKQATEIVSYFVQDNIQPWHVRNRLGDDRNLPLMCVLLGLALHETAEAKPSRGELLHRVVEAAHKRSGSDASGWAQQSDILCKIAMLSTDAGGGPVSPTDLGKTNLEMILLTTSKLVAEENGKLVFTVATMRLWFAAQALRKGWVDERSLVEDLPRLRQWVNPLAIFVATTDFESASRYLEPLVSFQPAIAAQVISDSTTEWGDGNRRKPSEYDIFAKRFHHCLVTWVSAISPLEHICSFTDSNGQLLKLRAGYSSPHTEIIFSNDPLLPAFSALLPQEAVSRSDHVYLYREPDEPSHLWRKTFDMIGSEMIRFIRTHQWEMADSDLSYEYMWHKIGDLTHARRWHAGSIPWGLVDKFLPLLQKEGFGNWISKMKSLNSHILPSPHPPADLNKEAVGIIHSFYSPSSALAWTQSVYKMALTAYQRIAATYFPNFINDLSYSAWWPCKLVGTISRASRNETFWVITYHRDPVSCATEAEVSFEIADNDDFPELSVINKTREKAKKLRPNAPDRYWTMSSVIDFHEKYPASALVRKWLLRDFQDIGWGS